MTLMLTENTITKVQIEALRAEAAAAGDTITVGDCDNALRFWGGRASIAPRRRLAQVINHAAAQR
jgi:hypothetical protein